MLLYNYTNYFYNFNILFYFKIKNISVNNNPFYLTIFLKKVNSQKAKTAIKTKGKFLRLVCPKKNN